MLYSEDMPDTKRQNPRREAAIMSFVNGVVPEAGKILDSFAREASLVDRGLFYPKVVFNATFTIDPFDGKKVEFSRKVRVPKMLELIFDTRFSWSGRKFPWFDRDWYEHHYHHFNPKDIYDSLGDGGIRVYLGTGFCYHYSHILIKKYGGGGSVDVYRGSLGKESLADILATDYAKSHINEGKLVINDFIDTLIETLESHLPESFIDSSAYIEDHLSTPKIPLSMPSQPRYHPLGY